MFRESGANAEVRVDTGEPGRVRRPPEQICYARRSSHTRPAPKHSDAGSGWNDHAAEREDRMERRWRSGRYIHAWQWNITSGPGVPQGFPHRGGDPTFHEDLAPAKQH